MQDLKDQHLIDELYDMQSQLSSYETKYNEQCKRIDDLNSQLADKEERIKELEERLQEYSKSMQLFIKTLNP